MSINQGKAHLFYHEGKAVFLLAKFGPVVESEPKETRQLRQNYSSAIDKFYTVMAVVLPGDWEPPADENGRKDATRQFKELARRQGAIGPKSINGYASKAGHWLAHRAASIGNNLVINGSLGSVLQSLLATKGLTPYELARELSIGASTLRHWIEGKNLPTGSASATAISKLEDFLKVPRDTLKALTYLPDEQKQKRTEYGEKLIALREAQERFNLANGIDRPSPSLPESKWKPRLKEEFARLVAWKKSEGDWTDNAKGECGAANKMQGEWEKAAGFCLAPPGVDPAFNGLGMCSEELGSDIFARTDVCEGILNFMAYRAAFDPDAEPKKRQRLYTTDSTNFVNTVSMMLHPKKGYIPQSPPPDVDLLTPERDGARLTESLSKKLQELLQFFQQPGGLFIREEDHCLTTALAELADGGRRLLDVLPLSSRVALEPIEAYRVITIPLGDNLDALDVCIADELQRQVKSMGVNCLSQTHDAMGWLGAISEHYPNSTLVLVLRDVLGFLKTRATGNGALADVSFMRKLCQASHGGLALRIVCSVPESALAHKELGPALQRTGYREMNVPDPLADHRYQCEKTRMFLKGWLKKHKAEIKKAREMTPGLQFVLAQRPSPLEYMLEVCDKLRRQFESTLGNEITKAVKFRQLLSIRWLLEVPFREDQTKGLKYKADNTGDVYFGSDGLIWVRQDKPKFKNRRSKWCKEWNAPVSAELTEIVKLYLEKHRPHLAGATTTDLFFRPERQKQKKGSKSTKNQGDGNKPMGSLGIWNILEPFIPLTSFGPHGFRAIAATEALTANPGDYYTAGRILNDDPETVRQAYGKQQHSDDVVNYTKRFEQIRGEQHKVNMLVECIAALRASGLVVAFDSPIISVLEKAAELSLPISAVLRALNSFQ